MFANMDYPSADGAFASSVRLEVADLLARLRHRPSTTVFCGNSEVEQQAAMLGLPREAWTNELFSDALPAMVQAACPGIPYWPSSPSGGALPFQVSAGVSHYYGVGAYQRPFDDARRASVRFTSECLAFANVPEGVTLDKILPDGAPPVHHPAWKARVPRDRGAGWDFDDVRDHYLEKTFGLSAPDVRYGDPERYLELSRVASGEAMLRTFSEWRRPGSTCRGGLVWFYRDFWPGAGWGVVDATGLPKAAYWHLRRVLQPRTLVLADEGLDGLMLHALNERDTSLQVELRTTVYRHGQTPVAEAAVQAVVPARGSYTVAVQSLLETFLDLTYAYRFGPPGHDLVVATMTELPSGEQLGATFYFPLGLPATREPDVGLEATTQAGGDGEVILSITTKRFAQSVAVDLEGGVPDDNYFHLAPGGRKTVRVKAAPGAKVQGVVRALNAHSPARIRAV
jgi:beta-mannosidase